MEHVFEPSILPFLPFLVHIAIVVRQKKLYTRYSNDQLDLKELGIHANMARTSYIML